MIRSSTKFGILAAIFSSIILSLYFQANATPAFARKEKKACAYCHLNPRGGGARGFRGIYYQNHKFSFKGFNEKKEAKLAGVKPGVMAEASKPTNPKYKVMRKHHKGQDEDMTSNHDSSDNDGGVPGRMGKPSADCVL